MIEVELKIDSLNTKNYYIKGTHIIHREDGPAVETANGDKFWYQNDQVHRLDGPAVENANGDKYWIQYGELHRLDGPAIELYNGVIRYFINNKELFVKSNKDFLHYSKLLAFI